MRLSDTAARARLAAAEHGVLATVHPVRGADVVPVVYASIDDRVAVPIDRVKPKTSGRLQRERNLELDPRATLLVDHWDRDDWSRLWWVRAQLEWQRNVSTGASESLADALRERYPQYADRPFERLLVFRLAALTGWSATP